MTSFLKNAFARCNSQLIWLQVCHSVWPNYQCSWRGKSFPRSRSLSWRSTSFNHFPSFSIIFPSGQLGDFRQTGDWQIAHDCTVCTSRHFRPAAHGWNAKWPAPLGRFAWLLARYISDSEFTVWSTWKFCQTLTTLHWCCFIGPGREKQPLGMEILESLVAILNQAYLWINR